MRILILYAHPNPASFCRAIRDRAEQVLTAAGHQVRVKDLYAEGFDPVLSAADLAQTTRGEIPEPIAREHAALLWAEGLVFVYPVWWFGVPAMLKGWLDRTLTYGVAFRYGEQGQEGLLDHKRAMSFCTLGSDQGTYQDRDWESLITRPLSEGTLAFCGIDESAHRCFYSVPGVDDAARRAMLDQVAADLAAFGPAAAP